MLQLRIKQLAEEILRAKYTYYHVALPANMLPLVITDKVYDAKEAELKALDPNHWVLKIVGAPVSVSEWKKAKHQIPMGSLDKVNTPDELMTWAKDKPNQTWFVIQKLDGISIELIYESGQLVQAITRGDGDIGEDITVNVQRMNGVNAKLTNNFSGSLRGEIIMLKSVWKADFADKANPRNAASGVSKRLDSVGVDKLHILFYQVLGDVDFKTELEQMQWLSTNGLAIPDYWHFNTIPEVNQHWRDYQDQQRAQLDYDIDGLVIRLNNLEAQLALGDKDLRPLGAIAFKFDNETRESTIREITWQVGNSGRLTPVATLDPVHLVGATITRASLYNLGYIQELGLDVGAKVLVARANDVIPRVEELVVGTGTVAQAPSACPACQGVTKKEGENLVCTNTQNCRSQIIGRIKNWITELNLLEWGDTLVEKLVDSQKVTTVADLYRLQPADIANLDRLGDKTAKKCLDILWSQVNLPLEVFLSALSIPLIGQSTIKAIINEGCDTLEKFGQLDAEAFAQVPGVGPTKAKSLADGLKMNQSLILDLLGAGINIKDKVQGKLTGCRIAITGSTKHKRADLEKFIMDHGGENKSSVGKSCTHLVIADTNSTSAKAVAARKLGIVLVTEDSLLNLTI